MISLPVGACADTACGSVSSPIRTRPETAAGDFGADWPEPDHPERLATHFRADIGLAVPVAAAHRSVGLWDVPRERHQQRDRVLGGSNGVALRRVDHDDAALSGRFEVDVVHADAGTADDLQAGAGLNDGACHLRFAADD